MNEGTAVRVGAYRLEEKLGEGGMGVVYRGRDERLGRDVAVKLLKRELATDPDRLRRFLAEARATAAVSHPNIVAIHDVGSWDGRPFIVTELLEGETLRDRIRSGALTVSRAVEYAIAMSRGLAAAHDRGIIHRDLKSENLFLTRDGDVKLLDFGIATLIENDPQRRGDSAESDSDHHDTQPGNSSGTPGCMSPEQIRGFPADQRTDVFAAGVALFEMLEGRRPFAGRTSGETMAMALNDDPPPLSRRTPAALRNVVMRCLEKRPEDRFSSAHDLALALAAVRAETVSAGPGGARPGTGGTAPVADPTWRRGAWLALAAAMVALAILGFRLLESRPDRGLSHDDVIPNRIAVVPFVCTGNCGSDEALGTLAAVHLARILTTLDEVEVVRSEEISAYPITSSPAVQRIAAATDAGLVVSGGFRYRGDEVEVSAALEEAASGRVVGVLGPMSADRTEPGPALDALGDQALIAVQDHLHPSLAFGAGDRWPNVEAYREYRVSLTIAGTAPLQVALDHVNRALELDPGFVRPRLFWSGVLTFARARERLGEVTLSRLQRLLPTDRSGMSLKQERILDGIQFRFEGNWRGAAQLFQTVLERDPRDCMSRLYVIDSAVCANHPQQAIDAFDGEEWDGVQPPQAREIAFAQTARAYHLLGQYDKELEVIESIGGVSEQETGRLWYMRHRISALAAIGDLTATDLAIQDILAEPSTMPFDQARVLLEAAEELREHGSPDAATRVAERVLEELQKSAYIGGHEPVFLECVSDALFLAHRPQDAYAVVLDTIRDMPDSFERSAVLGLAAARAGDRDVALRQMFDLSRVENWRPYGEADYVRARIAAQIRDPREAMRLLRRAVVNGFWDYPALRSCPDLESLRNDSEYQRLIEPKG